MNSVLEILWIILIYIFIQRIVLIGMGVVKKATSATQRKRDDFEEIEVEEEDLEEPIEMVTSFCCGKEIPRKKAYQIATEEGNTHFFCSWQCRQDFVDKQLNGTNQEEGI